jgi:ubiquitin-like-conjugating enzyme ATG3
VRFGVRADVKRFRPDAAVRLGELNIKEDYALNPVSLQQAGQRRDAAAASSEAKKKEEGREKSRADEAAKAQAEEDDGEDDVPDMEAFEEDNLEEDPAALPASKAQRAPAAGGDMLRAVEPEEEFVRTRTYDLSIAYDKYYQTPHVYLFGWARARSDRARGCHR